ncbi:DUF1800 domain-containing protein [Variovorax sp. RHLX14]|uniref:DUF1800 domain-containing protein n=1 Tax=Variovorax sp. RHLX14 TaxID=1259731 RepID=UPI003F45FD97
MNIEPKSNNPTNAIAEAQQDTESAGVSRMAIVPASLMAAVLQACGGGGGGGGSDGASLSAASRTTAGSSAVGDVAIPVVDAKPATDTEAARFLLQAQLSASADDIASVRSLGYAAWLSAQFGAAAGQTGWDWLNERGYDSTSSATAYYDQSYPSDFMIWKQLITAPDALRKRVALALSEIFVVSTGGIANRWRSHLMASWWDMLSSNALGNFRKLLEDVTLHPAMGVYLNVRGSQKENASTGRQPDENYAREVMQLMTIGLSQLNPDGTVRRGGDGAPLDSYTLSDVTNLARVFTGYDFDQSRNDTSASVGNTAFARLPMAFKANLHSTLDATFLGTTVAGGGNGTDSMKKALDTLFNHPNVGPFIARQLIQRLVTSNPSPAYVGRVAALFANDGRGVRGNLAATVAAILLDAEARDMTTLAAASAGRLREPVLRFVQWARTFGLQSAQGSWKIYDQSNPATQLGQSPLNSPSVFNFFRPGYVPPNTAIASAGNVAPEFQIVNETSVGGYLNFMQGAIRNGIYVNGADVPQASGGTINGFDLTAAYAKERELVADASALVARLNLLLAAGQLSDGTVRDMVAALNSTPVTAASSDSIKLNRIGAAVLMVMASPEYLVQK